MGHPQIYTFIHIYTQQKSMCINGRSMQIYMPDMKSMAWTNSQEVLYTDDYDADADNDQRQQHSSITLAELASG